MKKNLYVLVVKNLQQWSWSTVSQLLWWCHCQENVAHSVCLSLTQTGGSQKAPNPDYTHSPAKISNVLHGHTVFFLFLCEHLWDFPGANFTVFQRCHHLFQLTEADIQLCTQFPGHNLLIHVDELITTRFISWCDNCACLSECELLFTVTTAETHHPLPHSAHIHCFHKYSASSDECQWVPFLFLFLFFFAWRNSVTFICFVCTSTSGTILSDCPSAAICCTATICDQILTSTATPISGCDMVDQCNKIKAHLFQSSPHIYAWLGCYILPSHRSSSARTELKTSA